MKIDWDDESIAIDPGIRKVWGDFIHDSENWTHWFTVTFRVPQTRTVAGHVLRDWMHEVARTLERGHFWVAWVVERHVEWGFHVHGLMSLKAPSTNEQLLAALARVSDKVGRIQLDPYDAGKGAAWYICKTGKQELSMACPRVGKCKRSGRCTESSAGWNVG